ncbi:type ISP restriction/modification enzyme [Streptomyces sp. NPDC000348]|uniref:type ISP restriction/modification enzyme n=1 Tax=Streptomyces sp. NPDC000348 TaxID=3364538 RepID=UPI0036926EDB
MGGSEYGWLTEAVSDFGKACKDRLSGPGGPEAVIRRPIEDLLYTAGRRYGLKKVLWHDETRLDELGVRPDYAVQVDGAIIGYIEVKKPGLNIDPESFTGQNKRQWERLRDLPNLLYTNGTTWRLFRGGKEAREPVHFEGSLKSAGGKLSVPTPANLDSLLRTFLGWEPEPIRSVSTLVQRIAPLCRLLRAAVLEQLAAEKKAMAAGASPSKLPFIGLARDWRKLLFPTADDATFADGYAQAVTFALLLARTEDISLTGTSLHEIGKKLHAGHSLMGKALQLFTDNVDDRFEVTLDLLVRVVASVEWEPIRKDRQDAYLHLYESFLEVYDDELRQRSGSYYTPREVVEEMVRLTDDVLRTRLGKAEGFADQTVFTVDPAMGTGTYLHAIIERVAQRAAERYGPGMVPQAISDLAARLVGFELQMGPSAVAELRTSDLLKKYGASLPEGGTNLYVTDTLDNPYVKEEAIASTYGAISESRDRANKVKAHVPVNAVIGNPPYGGKAEGRGGWVEHGAEGKGKPLLDDFRFAGNGRHEHLLKNLYIYFWRWAAWKVFDAHPEDQHGVVCFITPNAVFNGPGGRGMRAYLRDTCDEGWVINVSPEGHRPDVPTRIFPGVAQPLAICIFLRRADADHSQPAIIHYREVHGRRAEKYQQLKDIRLDDGAWQVARTDSDAPFTPAQLNWDAYPRLSDLFPWESLGVTTNRGWVQSPGRQILEQRWKALINEDDVERKAKLFKETNDRTLGKKLDGLPGRSAYNVPIGQETAQQPDLLRISLRSFDRQWLIADRRVMDRPRPDLWEALQPGQVFLNQQSARPIESGPAVVATALLQDTNHFNGRAGRVLPMLHPDGTGNVPTGLLTTLTSRLGIADVTVQDLAAYVMAVAGHSGFTQRFKEELLTPGVRVPLTSDSALWEEAVRLGEEVLWTSTYGEAFTDREVGRKPGDIAYALGDPRQIRYLTPIGSEVPHEMRYEAATQVLHLGAGSFGPVPEEVWNYDVGGMGIIKKWFGYRKARPDSKRSSPLDDIHVEQWPSEWSAELIELLTVLRRLVELAPAQGSLLERILATPLITEEALKAEGVLPVADKARKPRLSVTFEIFETADGADY